MAFQDMKSTQKGNLGEQLVDKLLMEKGLIPYKPVADVAHPFDRLCATADKRNLYVAEVKTKARRNKYPDTGFDYKHFNIYMSLMKKHNLDIIVYFVDESLGQIYGGELVKISEPHDVHWTVNGKQTLLRYPKIESTKYGEQIIYFPLELMTVFADLPQGERAQLKQLNTRAYDYHLVDIPSLL